MEHPNAAPTQPKRAFRRKINTLKMKMAPAVGIGAIFVSM
ncbi:hypothetical protein DT23_17010 [Thioclava indica]|uniref:Uncharacterized protein n=1 Tax=Thioclava indica TaxID=1353528 RepID=A0A074K6U9_9RHOB|nr:hypothetical protein DT23_17010 [Thioclava indica]